jgi:hypothetical protein
MPLGLNESFLIIKESKHAHAHCKTPPPPFQKRAAPHDTDFASLMGARALSSCAQSGENDVLGLLALGIGRL